MFQELSFSVSALEGSLEGSSDRLVGERIVRYALGQRKEHGEEEKRVEYMSSHMDFGIIYILLNFIACFFFIGQLRKLFMGWIWKSEILVLLGYDDCEAHNKILFSLFFYQFGNYKKNKILFLAFCQFCLKCEHQKEISLKKIRKVE